MKARKQRQNFRTNPLSKRSQDHKIDQVDTHKILDDMSSLDESRRFSSCRLFSNIVGTNCRNESSMTKLTSPEVMAKLNIRLVDSSLRVRSEAIGIVRNFALSSYSFVTSRILECGVIDIMLSYASEILSSSGNVPLKIQLLSCFSNLASSNEIYFHHFVTSSETLLAASIRSFSGPLELRIAAINFLLILTDRNREIADKIVEYGLTTALLEQMAAINLPSVINVEALSELTLFLVGLKSLGAFLNVIFFSSNPIPVLNSVRLSSFLPNLISVLQKDNSVRLMCENSLIY